MAPALTACSDAKTRCPRLDAADLRAQRRLAADVFGRGRPGTGHARVATALLGALVVLPPILVWAEQPGWITRGLVPAELLDRTSMDRGKATVAAPDWRRRESSRGAGLPARRLTRRPSAVA